MEEEIKNYIYIISLQNAIENNNKTMFKSIFGKAINKYKEIKKDIKYYQKLTEEIVDKINKLSPEEQVEELKKLNPDYFNKNDSKKENNKKEKKLELPELPNVPEKIRVRFAPAPTGYLHLGHIYGILLNNEYSKKYNGEFILRLEDTNPENISLENYENIIEDVKWLTENNISEIYYQSDRVEIYYEKARELIEKGGAYICTCSQESFKQLIEKSKPCPCRELSTEEQKIRFEKLFNKYKQGEAVMRFKADLKNKNPALRDFPIMRINETEHPRVGKKYRVWPLYNFSTAIDDSLMGINYILRGKDGEINGIRQDMIKDILGLPKSNYYHIGRVKFEDVNLSKRDLKSKIEIGKYEGWDDPRVPTIVSFRKRGFLPEAFRNLVISQGLSKRDSKISYKDYMKTLVYFNKQILEKISPRYSFIKNPKTAKIINFDKVKENFKDNILKIRKHPDKDLGFRIFNLKEEVYIDKEDFEKLKEGENLRLMHFANFKIIKKKKSSLEVEFLSLEYDKTLKCKIITFLTELYKKVKVIMEDNSIIEGYTEDIDERDKNIQFERFGFCKLDRIEKNNYIFYFTHR